MFHCGKCHHRWTLVSHRGESETEYAERLRATAFAPCPQCGDMRPKCRLRVPKLLKDTRRETE
jgi:hypothetical protein